MVFKNGLGPGSGRREGKKSTSRIQLGLCWNRQASLLPGRYKDMKLVKFGLESDEARLVWFLRRRHSWLFGYSFFGEKKQITQVASPVWSTSVVLFGPKYHFFYKPNIKSGVCWYQIRK